MEWRVALSERLGTWDALEECLEALGEGVPADLGLLFVTPHHRPALAALQERLVERLGTAAVVGCVAAGVVAGREVEGGPGLALVTARLPGVRARAVSLVQGELPDADAGPSAWEELVGASPADRPHFLLLADPLTFPMEDLLLGLDFAFPDSVKVGGLASGAEDQGVHLLAAGPRVQNGGAAVMVLEGALEVDALVGQGCRPIGPPLRVTGVRRHFLLSLEGRPPLAVLQELYRSLPRRLQALFPRHLLLGTAVDLSPEGPADFLMRNILEVDPVTGALAVGALLREGQVVRFHLLDPQAAEEDLTARLMAYCACQETPPAGILLFSCVGRGRRLFSRPDHDTALVRRFLGPAPVGGFFTNGEIGPIGDRSFLLAYTTTLALFRPARQQ